MSGAIHLAAGSDRVRCNRQGMRSFARETVGELRATDNLTAVTCRDCKRLGAIDLKGRENAR